ncbi:MAG: SH3 domain-containing protein, partial [Devosia sp.]
VSKADSTSAKATIQGKGNGDLAGRTARIEASITARARPDSSAQGVFRTEPGERVRILDVEGDWLHIRTADGSSGWIQAG